MTRRRTFRRFFRSSFFPILIIGLIATAVYLLINNVLMPETHRSSHMPGDLPENVASTVLAHDSGQIVSYGRARLRLDSGAEVRLYRTGNRAEHEVELQRGRVSFDVTRTAGSPEFIVHTPNATVGVRGTLFWVEVVGVFLTRVHVETGTVYVRGQTGPEFILQAGQDVEVMASQEPTRNDGSYSAIPGTEMPFDLREALGLGAAPATVQLGSGSTLDGIPHNDTSPGQIARLQGVGSWRSEDGSSGMIRLTLDPASGKFEGTLDGHHARTNNAFRGTCGGTFTGNADDGSLAGWFELEGEGLPPIQGHASGSMSQRVATGSIAAGPWNARFEVQFR